jgi:hypothetical protein
MMLSLGLVALLVRDIGNSDFWRTGLNIECYCCVTAWVKMMGVETKLLGGTEAKEGRLQG